MNIKGVLFVEIYVGMAKIVSWWHQIALGFVLKGIKENKGKYGPEITYWLQHGEANILITSALDPAAHDIISFVDRHGNSIKRFGIEVESIEETKKTLQDNQAIFMTQIMTETCGDETSSYVNVKLFDDNELTFVERKNTDAPFAGFKKTFNEPSYSLIKRIDHLASAVRINEASFWNDYLQRILKLNVHQTLGEEFFANMLTGMKMFVLNTPNHLLNKVIVEPIFEKEKESQVDVFLKNHFGNGIQHLAFEVYDLVITVEKLKLHGVNFVTIPNKYYDDLALHSPELPIEILRKANILCEKDGDKILLQIFTEPIGDRPTLFYEFIQRINDYRGFGETNVKQLFKSLEQLISDD